MQTARMTESIKLMLVHKHFHLEFALGETCTSIGRDSCNDIVIDFDRCVSRFHARIFSANGVYYIEDLGSTNGTKVNGERVKTRRILTVGDRIILGVSELLFCDSGFKPSAQYDDLEKVRERQLRGLIRKASPAIVGRLEPTFR